MNVGAVALIGGGALLMHAALTAVSPLSDLQNIFKNGVAGSLPATAPAGTTTVVPVSGAGVSGTGLATGQNTSNTSGKPGSVAYGPDPLPGG